MKRKYYHYRIWEDHKAGLYNLDLIDNPEDLIRKSAELLKNTKLFYETMLKVISQWKNATEINMTNTSRNRQAWLGQASCCYLYGSPEYITKIAWRKLTKEKQEEANKTADKIINRWEKTYNNGIKHTINYSWEEFDKMYQDKKMREGKQTTLI